MLRNLACTLAVAMTFSAPALAANSISGTYLEARTCQIYTGPCFANGEVGSAGKDAVMSWSISKGKHNDVDLAGLAVALVVKSSHTLAFNGLADAKTLKAMIFVDANANSKQQEALRSFVVAQTGIKQANILAVQSAPIAMEFDKDELNASVTIGRFAKVTARKARKGDCICSNESAYYPPLTKLTGFVPGVTIEGDVSARPLGTRWSIPDTRTAYLGLFRHEATDTKLAAK